MANVTPLLGPIITTLITGTLALLGLIITKEAKVSELRQAWIDALRTEVADFLASAHQAMKILEKLPEGVAQPDTKEFRDTLRDANKALFVIRLRLNPAEDKSKRLMSLLDEVEEYSGDVDLENDRSTEFEKKILEVSRQIMKEEWDRVRRGEVGYRRAKNGFRIALAALFALFMYVVVQSVDFASNGQRHANEATPAQRQEAALPRSSATTDNKRHGAPDRHPAAMSNNSMDVVPH